MYWIVQLLARDILDGDYYLSPSKSKNGKIILHDGTTRNDKHKTDVPITATLFISLNKNVPYKEY